MVQPKESNTSKVLDLSISKQIVGTHIRHANARQPLSPHSLGQIQNYAPTAVASFSMQM